MQQFQIFKIKPGEKEGLLACIKRFKCAQEMREQQSGKIAKHTKRWKDAMTPRKKITVNRPENRLLPILS